MSGNNTESFQLPNKTDSEEDEGKLQQNAPSECLEDHREDRGDSATGGQVRRIDPDGTGSVNGAIRQFVLDVGLKKVLPGALLLFIGFAGARLYEWWIQPAPEPHVIAATPQSLNEWYDNFPNDLQAQAAASVTYVGKHVRWGCAVQSVSKGSSGEGYLLCGDYFAIFDNVEDLEDLNTGDRIMIIGRISSMGFTITLEECRIVERLAIDESESQHSEVEGIEEEPVPPAGPFLAKSASQLSKWYADMGNEIIADEAACSVYYGKHVEWTGVVTRIAEGWKGIAYLYFDGFSVEIEDLATVASLRNGLELTVRGKIGKISPTNVHLKDAVIASAGAAKSPTPIPISAAELVHWYAAVDNDLLADQIATERYLGKYVLWRSSVTDVVRDTSTTSAICCEVFCALLDDEQPVYELSVGDTVTVLGRIRALNSSGVLVTGARIVSDGEGSD